MFRIKGRFTTDDPSIYHYPSRQHVLETSRMEDIENILRRRRLAFYVRVLGRDKRLLPLRRVVSLFEIPGAESTQRTDGRRSWWSAQLRADSLRVGVPTLVGCVSHWETEVKKFDFLT